MSIKKMLFFTFSLFFVLLFPSKISAISEIYYCNYENDLSLVLPVTIGADIKTRNLNYSFSAVTESNVELFVYDENSCNSYLNIIPSSNAQGIVVTADFYYKYNNEKKYVDYIGGGTLSIKDIVAPTIISYFELYGTNTERLVELDKISSFIVASDEIDGNIIPEIIYDNYSENYNKIGEYSIIFKACDKSNNCSTFNQKIKVNDNIAPSINGPEYLKTNISNPLTLQEITNQLVALDNHDGDISSQIYIVENNYNNNKVGKYYCIFSIKDSSNNTIKVPFKVTIEVIDDIAPTIEGPTLFISKLSNILSTKTILSNMIVTDNHDSSAYKNLYIIDDTYSTNQKNVGEYTLVIGAYDEFGNESLPYIITIKVIDDILPTIQGERFYESYLSNPIDLFSIKSSLIAMDNFDGNIFNKLEITNDTYSNNKDNIGVYQISFIVIDSSGNISSPHIVEIVVYDDILPLISGINFYNTLDSNKLDIYSIQLSLTATDNIDGDISNNIILDKDTYSDNYQTIGTYFLSFYVTDKSGNISMPFKVKINVNENLSYLQLINNSYIYISTDYLKTEIRRKQCCKC